MPGQLLRLSHRLLNTPLLIHPAKAEIILGALSGRIGLDASLFEVEEGLDVPDASRFVGSARRADGSTSMTRTTDGVALIPVLDTLVNRGAWLDSRSGLTSYEGIAAQLRDAGQDPEVRSVLLDVSSADLTDEQAQRVLDAGEPGVKAGMQVAAGGPIGTELSPVETESSEVIGIVAAWP